MSASMCDCNRNAADLFTQDGCFQCTDRVHHTRDYHQFGQTFFEHGHGSTQPKHLTDQNNILNDSTNTTPTKRMADRQHHTIAVPIKLSTNFDSLFSPFPPKPMTTAGKRGPTSFFPMLGRCRIQQPPKKRADTIPSPVKRLNRDLSKKDKVYQVWQYAEEGESLFDPGEALMYLSSNLHLNKSKSHQDGCWYEELPSYRAKLEQRQNAAATKAAAPAKSAATALLDEADQQEEEDLAGKKGSMKNWLLQHSKKTSIKVKPTPPKKKEPPAEKPLPKGTKSRLDTTWKTLRPMLNAHYRENPKLLKVPVEQIVQRLNKCFIEVSEESKKVPETFKPKAPKPKGNKKGSRKSTTGGSTGEE
ncbi:hypothetical protein SEMRO_778_G201170.1 [Seminavis robusta]|uniref:Uncharacterized protein n=1 Tax=Seminavis robusta TaxID=568900 RepID=A0A9N8HKU3_9STRA|nr:hypothetical protein SEMRO_778_G201170.1 [Seminavis robusta]|eukprot:Sro778_g201170.1 n/a (360) ;mRNA; f:27348-28427